MVLSKCFLVSIQEIPIQSCEWAGIIANPKFRIVFAAFSGLRHAVYVCTTGGIRFGHKFSTISVQTHPDHVWNHDPFTGINELFAHPVKEFQWLSAGNQRKVTQNHQTWDVMRPRSGFNVGNYALDAIHFGLTRVLK